MFAVGLLPWTEEATNGPNYQMTVLGKDGIQYCLSYNSPSEGSLMKTEKCDPDDKQQTSFYVVFLYSVNEYQCHVLH